MSVSAALTEADRERLGGAFTPLGGLKFDENAADACSSTGGCSSLHPHWRHTE